MMLRNNKRGKDDVYYWYQGGPLSTMRGKAKLTSQSSLERSKTGRTEEDSGVDDKTAPRFEYR